MPYLEPAHVLRQFSSYLHHDVRDAIADDHKFVHGQVGSMSSSLRFLAMELESMGEDLEAQRESLLDALSETETVLDGIDTGTADEDAAETDGDDVREAVETAVATAREAVETADSTDPYEFERELTGAATDVLDAVEGLDEQDARRVRQPLYSFLETRIRTQLEALGADMEARSEAEM